MKITNKAGLHPLVYRAVLAQAKAHPSMEDEPRFASVTEIIDPACKVALTRRHWAQLEEEAEKRLAALHGSAVHYIVASGSRGKGARVEERLPLEVGGQLITGGFDSLFLEENWLSDYKWCKVWAIVFGDSIPGWKAQVNIYAEMVRLKGWKIDKLSLELFFKDWKRGELETDRRASAKCGQEPNYPEKDWQRLPVRIWPTDEVLEFVQTRISALEAALAADVPVECSREERWEKETTWAVFKGKNKRATKVFKEESKKETRADAEAWIAKQKKPGDYHIEDRPGKRVRCLDYCVVKDFCPHFKAHQEELYGRNFGPDKDEQTRPPEMECSASGEQTPQTERPKVDFFGATPVTAGVKRSRKGSK